MNRALVVVPHPDDDVLGCGEYLSHAFARGEVVRIIYLTDGAASHPHSTQYPPERLVALRETEARHAIAELGGADAELTFLRLPDGALNELPPTSRDTTIATLTNVIERWQPTIVFVPWRRDPHPDHVVTSLLVRTALERSTRKPQTLEYSVWLGIRGEDDDAPNDRETSAVTFTASAEDKRSKRRALLEHRSQTTDLIGDDPAGFTMSPELIEQFLAQPEIFHESAS